MSTIWVETLGSETRFYDAGGVRTRCIEAGTGEAVIFLHGVGGHGEAFGRNVLPFAERYRAVALDYLGFGMTDGTESQPTHEDYVRHLIDFMDAAGIERAHLVGESLGGWVAFWTAILHPDRVARLVSVCGAHLDVETDEASIEHAASGLAELQRLTKKFVEEPSRENIRNRLFWLFKNPERDVSDELVDLRWALYRRDAARKQLAVTAPGTQQTAAAKLGPAELGSIRQPTLMLWTSDNPTTTSATARRATEYLPDGRFVEMDDCAHWPQWEDPDTFNRIVMDFLAEG